LLGQAPASTTFDGRDFLGHANLRNHASRYLAATWYDAIADQQVTAFATAICEADVGCEDMIAGIEQARMMAAVGRVPFVEQVGDTLEQIVANREVPSGDRLALANANKSERRH
jgi:hypothetical protein